MTCWHVIGMLQSDVNSDAEPGNYLYSLVPTPVSRLRFQVRLSIKYLANSASGPE